MIRFVAAGFGWLSGMSFGAWASHQTVPNVGPDVAAASAVLFAVAAGVLAFTEVADVGGETDE